MPLGVISLGFFYRDTSSKRHLDWFTRARPTQRPSVLSHPIRGDCEERQEQLDMSDINNKGGWLLECHALRLQAVNAVSKQ